MKSSIRVWVNGEKQPPHKRYVFSGGEVHINVSRFPAKCSDYYVEARVRDSEGLVELLLLCEALWARYPSVKEKKVYLPYLPYARQDRRCAEGDSFSSAIIYKTILKGITDLGYTVSVLDVHSSVGESILKSQTRSEPVCYSVSCPLNILFRYSDPRLDGVTLVSPDRGAMKKVEKFAAQAEWDTFHIIYGEKKRNPETGELSGFKIDRKDIGGKDVLIIDDICDGGGTFVGLAEELKKANCGKIYLYVTHGIFSNGLLPFYGLIDKVFTTDSFCTLTPGTWDGVELDIIRA